LVHSTFHFFGDRADLTIGPPRGEHQRVKGIDELTQVEHHAVQTQLLAGALERGVEQGSDIGAEGAASTLAARQGFTQWATPSTKSAAAKGNVRHSTPSAA
jgi:hypothetical protein